MELEQRHQLTQRVTVVGALVNALLASLQILFGILGKSQALLADGIHTLSDLASDGIVLIASRSASRQPDESHPYGHGRIETFVSMLLGAVLVAVGAGIGFRGIEAITLQDTTRPEAITLLFAFLAIVAKESLYRYTMAAAKRNFSALLEANAWHHRSDALSSIIVVIGIGGQLLGIPYMDAAASVIVALMISWMGLQLSRDALSELVDSSLDGELVDEIHSAIAQQGGVAAVHSLRTRSMGGLGFVDAEVLVNPRVTVSEAHHVTYLLEQYIKENFPQVIDVRIHVDPLSESGHGPIEDLPARPQVKADLEQAWAGETLADHVLFIGLHYLGAELEVDLVFPLDYFPLLESGELERLRKLANRISYVGKVNIFFREIR